MKLYGAKNNCAHASFRESSGQKDTKRPKNTQLSLLKIWEQKQGTAHAPKEGHTKPPKRWAKHLGHISSWTPGHTSSFTLYQKPCNPYSLLREGAKEPISCSHSPLLHSGPSKALPGFLVWPLVHFYWLGKSKNLVSYQYRNWGSWMVIRAKL